MYTMKCSRLSPFRLVTALIISLLTVSIAQAAPKAELWPRWRAHDPGSTQTIDHVAWDRFLKKYVVSPHPSGINRVRYDAVTPEDRKLLKSYLQHLQRVPISSFNKAEQKAYWINLYNALTVDLVLSHYPVKSILDINISPGIF